MNNVEAKYLEKAFTKNNWVGWENNPDLNANLTHKEKNGLHLYNYNDCILVQRDHPVLMKCRGLIVDEHGKIMNYPFERFFNSFEKECIKIDWKTAVAQEKIDGSLVCVSWSGNNWEVTTRGAFYPLETSPVDFAKLFKKQFSKFGELEKTICYMFELVSKDNRIITLYKDEFVVLLGARDLKTFKEISQGKLDDWANSLNVRRPKQYKVIDLDNSKKLFEKMKKDEEGLVIVDSAFDRLKLKQESYYTLSKIRALKNSGIFDFILGRTELDAEFIEAFPEVKERINELTVFWKNKKLEVNKIFDNLKGLADKSRKAFALEAVKYNCKGELFALLDNKKLEDFVRFSSYEDEFCKVKK